MKTLYHGSPTKLDIIHPLSDFASEQGQIVKVIYASQFLEFAAPFSFTVCKDSVSSSYNIDFSDGQIKRIYTVNCHVNFSKFGFLYKLDASKFQRVDSCQWVCTEALTHHGYQLVDPSEYRHFIEVITHQYAELKKNP